MHHLITTKNILYLDKLLIRDYIELNNKILNKYINKLIKEYS